VIYDFDEADSALTLLPMAARRALDASGWKLTLAGYQSLPHAERIALVEAGAAAQVQPARVLAILARATPAATAQPPVHEPSDLPAALTAALGAPRVLSLARWQRLTALDRYVLVKLQSRGRQERLERAFDEIARLRTF